ncbi:unnamed protein product [Symbiodinium sp. CCMP2592]|nr:unnamed protein product [Symbiodinium sp. CCMP2592]
MRIKAQMNEVKILSSSQPRFQCPPDGLPCVRDWITLFESMVCTGIDLAREPLSVSMDLADGGKLRPATVDIYKGFTKASVIAFCLCVLTDLDVEEQWPLIEPFTTFLDRVSLSLSAVDQSFSNLALSYRGAERQAPSIISLALRFNDVLKTKSKQACFPAGSNVEKRIEAIVEEFNGSSLMTARFAVDSEKIKAISNIIVGTCEETLALMQSHLHTTKWKDSAFSHNLLKSNRWLIGASRRVDHNYMRSLLVVTAPIQEFFVRNHILAFLKAGRRLRSSARAKCRPSVEQFEQAMDYCCVMYHLVEEATKQFPKKDMRALMQAVDNRLVPSFTLQVLSQSALCLRFGLPVSGSFTTKSYWLWTPSFPIGSSPT